ncbi:MAG: hypothetical protein K9I29_05690 [Bacteroidales bacterium]|nr:hypothetical protein [Bacteroidales bacterium]MCF8327768.1 hypothetical protein [Bacteroidales bacterium]
MIKEFKIALLWGIIILFLVSLPGDYIPAVHSPWNFITLDKLIHAGLFYVWVFFLIQGFRLQYRYPFFRSYSIISGIIVGIVFGGLTETWQSIINVGRYADIYDFVANSAGAILAGLTNLLLKNKVQ